MTSLPMMTILHEKFRFETRVREKRLLTRKNYALNTQSEI